MQDNYPPGITPDAIDNQPWFSDFAPQDEDGNLLDLDEEEDLPEEEDY